jgi:phospholipase/carboxylesterase
MFDLSLMGRLSFRHATPVQPPLSPPLPLPALPPGRNFLGIAAERDAILYVPQALDLHTPVPLLVMFHGAGGFPEKVLPFLEEHAERRKFLILAPHSMYATWDIVVGGNGPDLERLDKALAEVASHFPIDPQRLAFAGFSDGASYALSTGITNGDIASHVIAFSGGFMTIFMQEGSPQVFIAHGLVDEQLPIATSGRTNAARLSAAGYDVQYVEFNGKHVIEPAIVNMAIDFFLK